MCLVLLLCFCCLTLQDRVPLVTIRPVLAGRDVVAYHEKEIWGAGEQGNKDHVYNFTGFQFWFSSEEHKRAFIKDPWRYAPAYGGFSVLGIGMSPSEWNFDSLGPAVGVDNSWCIYNGRLYFAHISSAMDEFWRNPNPYIKKASKRWQSWFAHFHFFSRK
eukprot:TRINITY_DN2672_c0_g2_i4.p1 TRINITY_DN2672_c0_g2~~TRINITY_DN2672_c0_g2_i4.p1  ORF type:complete len:160 (-),score=21.35 TRINITY_DN2672_c0_g2_i4:87-566(-)